jgi:hypothetical protein
MSFSPTTPLLLQGALDDLKRRDAGQHTLTNYFFQSLNKSANLRMLTSQRSLCFLNDEWDFSRFHFCTFHLADLQEIFHGINWPPIVVVDWISKNGSASVDSLLSGAGFHLHAIYDRILCRNFRCERPEGPVQLAKLEELDTIHCLLLRVFDKYADHINSVEELAELISRQQVVVSRDPQGKIDGFVVFPIAGSSCNFNFLYNSGGPVRLVKLLGSFYGALAERGVQSGFSWVRRTRPMVLKLHQSFGWKTDGLVDYIYMK